MEIIFGLKPRTTLQDVVEALQARPNEWIAVRDLPLEARNQDGLLFLRLGPAAPKAAPAVPPAAPTVTTVPKPAPAPHPSRPLQVPKPYEAPDRVQRARAKHLALAQELAAANGGVLVVGLEPQYRTP